MVILTPTERETLQVFYIFFLRKNYQDDRPPKEDSNRIPPEHKPEVLPPQSTCSLFRNVGRMLVGRYIKLLKLHDGFG
jgi:hypothetical protein